MHCWSTSTQEWHDLKPVWYVTCGPRRAHLALHITSWNQTEFTKGKAIGWVVGPRGENNEGQGN